VHSVVEFSLKHSDIMLAETVKGVSSAASATVEIFNYVGKQSTSLL
jgi:hypothetical protein